jgi:hypothetical protein
MYNCEKWKSTNQTAISSLMPHEIFSLYAKNAEQDGFKVLQHRLQMR